MTETTTESVAAAKRLIAAVSPEGARLLGAGVSRPCSQGRYNAAAQAALTDFSADFSPGERRLIARHIQSEEPEARSGVFRLRMSEEELARLARLAADAGMSGSEYVRQLLLYAEANEISQLAT